MKKILIILFVSIICSTNLFSGFIRNEGQWNEEVVYMAEFTGYNAWFMKDKIRFEHYNYEFENGIKVKNGYVYDMMFSGNNKFDYNEHNQINAINRISKEGIAKTYEYQELIIDEIYDGIDAFFHIDKNILRYDFKIEKDADYSQIELLFSSTLNINDNELLIQTDHGNIIHNDLKAFNKKSNIPVSFVNQNGNVKFNIQEKIESGFTIDPIIFSTYFGGNRFDFSRDMVLDDDQNIYITGFTSSTNFPTDTGAYSRSLETSQWDYPDIFVSKFTPDGKELIFSTYIGGLGDDYGEGITVDTSGYVYITGYTWPIEFPLTENSILDTAQGGYDAFIIKLTPEGDSLVYSTLIGGTKDDYGIAIDVNNASEAYITGYFTSDGEYPVTDNAFLRVSRGKYDAFLTRINAAGDDIIYSTYFAGSNDDFGQDIVLYDDGRAVFCGRTSSNDLLTTPDAFDRDFASTDTSDAFYGIISADGSTLIYSSYFGGTKEDGSYSLALDRNENIYISGYTESTDMPVSDDAYDKILNNDINLAGNSDAFVAKFDATGSNLIFSTYYGGTAAERVYSMAVDENDFPYIAGTTNSGDMHYTRAAVDTTVKGLPLTSDAFAARFEPHGSELSYATYLGGSFNEVARAMAVNKNDYSIIVTGMTNSEDFFIENHVVDSTYNDTLKADIFLTRIMPSFINFTLGPDLEICQGDTLGIGAEARGGFGDLTYIWEPNLFISDSTSPFILTYPDTTTTYKLTVLDTADHEEIDYIRIEVYPKPDFELVGALSVPDNSVFTYNLINEENIDSVMWHVQNGSILNSDNNSAEIQWNTGPSGALYVEAFSEEGCRTVDSLLVLIGEKFRFDLNIIQFNDVLCEDDFAILEPDQDYEDYFYSDGTRTKLDTIYNTGEYYLIVKDEDGFYGISDTVFVEFVPKPDVFINGNDLCYIDSTYSYQIPNEADVTYELYVIGGEILSNANGILSIHWGEGPNGSIELIAENAAGCADTININILIGNFGKPIITATDSDGNIFEGNFDFCTGDTITLDAGAGYATYEWQDSSNTRYHKVWQAGTYWVNTVDLNGEPHYSDTLDITTLQQPPKPQVTILGDRLRCNTIAKSYQWFINGNIANGLTERLFTPKQSGYYQVEITANNNCKNISDSIFFNASSIKDAVEYGLEITPNPADDILEISYSSSNKPFSLEMYDAKGDLVKSIDNIIINQKINISELNAGYYNLVFYINDEIFTYKLMVLR